MKLATIQSIASVEAHPNADLLEIVQVKGYKAIVKKGQWKAGDFCVFIEPDSVLPDKPWAAFYKAKSNRVKAVKLRGQWSFGIVESLNILGDVALRPENLWAICEGVDVTDHLGIAKYEAPAPQDLAASGPYGFGIPKTDESRWQSFDTLPFGEKVDVTLKIDGQSFSAIWTVDENGEEVRAIGGRSFLYKLDSINNFTQNQANHDVLNRLSAFCRRQNGGAGLCIRGEQYGRGIQKGAHNPHSQLPLGLAFFSTWLISERRYAHKGHPMYIHEIAPKMGLPTVPILEHDVILTPELIKKYSEDLIEVNGKPFEGVVINWSGGSFKVINLSYDSKK